MIVKCRSMLFFVRGGYVYPGSSNPFSGVGREGDYWSSRAGSSTGGAYSLGFYGTSVNPSSDSARYVGYPLRCLIPTT